MVDYTTPEKIAFLEEEVKTMTFKLADARWTVEHMPGQIEALKGQIAELQKA